MEVTTVPTPPIGANILCGSLDDATGTIITIPAGRTWVGHIVINATVAHTVVATCKVTVATPNTAGVFPQNTVVARAVSQCPANGSNSSDSASFVTVVNTTGSGIALTVAETVSAGTGVSSVQANGVLL